MKIVMSFPKVLYLVLPVDERRFLLALFFFNQGFQFTTGITHRHCAILPLAAIASILTASGNFERSTAIGTIDETLNLTFR